MSKFEKPISCHIDFPKYVFCIKLNALRPPLKNIINDMLNMPRSTYFAFNRLDNYLVVAFSVKIPNVGLYCNLEAISERPRFRNQNRGCIVVGKNSSFKIYKPQVQGTSFCTWGVVCRELCSNYRNSLRCFKLGKFKGCLLYTSPSPRD